MEDLQIEYIDIDKIKPYEGNAKEHPREQIEQIKNSIENFDMIDPIGIWQNEIVEGHGRYLACKELGYDKVPIIRLDHLTDEERKAYTLIHNQLTLNTGYNLDTLKKELDKLKTFKMEDFGFNTELKIELPTDERVTSAELTEERRENIFNLMKARFEGVGKYDIPEILPLRQPPKVKEWISFNYVLSDKDPRGKGVHFFIDDYQFERIWNNIDAYVDKLLEYECVLSPDFSPYADMPLATQIFNHYRKHWVGRYLQEQGVVVIPTIRASRDKRSYDYYLDGEPKNSVVCISSMWATKDDESYNAFLKEYNTMYDTLKPTKVFIYGKEIDGLRGNIEYIKTFAEGRWGKEKEVE